VGVVVAIVGGALGIVFGVLPNCRPTPTPDITSAKIEGADLEPGVTFRYYLDRSGSPTGTLSPEQLRKRGTLVVLHLSFQGFAGKHLLLRWQLYDSSGTSVGEPRDDQVTPSRNTDDFDELNWVAPAGASRRFYLVATLWRPGGAYPPLSSYRTRGFPGLA
jgi:hypothetical protein